MATLRRLGLPDPPRARHARAPGQSGGSHLRDAADYHSDMISSLVPPEKIRTVAVLGAGGTVGASWAPLFLHYGFDVLAQDLSPNLAARLDDFVVRADAALQRLQPTTVSRGRLTLT